MRVAQHTLIHVSLMRAAQHQLTCTSAAESCIGQTARQASTLTHERGHASLRIVNREPWTGLISNDNKWRWIFFGTRARTDKVCNGSTIPPKVRICRWHVVHDSKSRTHGAVWVSVLMATTQANGEMGNLTPCHAQTHNRSSPKCAYVIMSRISTYTQNLVTIPQGVSFSRYARNFASKMFTRLLFFRVLPTAYSPGTWTDFHA